MPVFSVRESIFERQSGLAGAPAIALACVIWLFLSISSHAADFETLKGHGGPVMDISVSPADGVVATASFDNAVGIWSGRQPRWLDGHEAAVKVVRFVDESRVVSAGDDFDLILWKP